MEYITAFFFGMFIALWIVCTIMLCRNKYKRKTIERGNRLTKSELKAIEEACLALKGMGTLPNVNVKKATAAMDKLVYGSDYKEVIV